MLKSRNEAFSIRCSLAADHERRHRLTLVVDINNVIAIEMVYLFIVCSAFVDDRESTHWQSYGFEAGYVLRRQCSVALGKPKFNTHNRYYSSQYRAPYIGYVVPWLTVCVCNVCL